MIRINPDIIPEVEFDSMEKLNEQIQQFINAHDTKPDPEMGGLPLLGLGRVRVRRKC